MQQSEHYLELLDAVCARYRLDPIDTWHTRTPRQLATLHRMAQRGKWRDDGVILRAGGYTREEPNWQALWGLADRGRGAGAGGGGSSPETKVEEQARLQLQHADQIAGIKARLRAEKKGGGGLYGLSRDVKMVLAGG